MNQALQKQVSVDPQALIAKALESGANIEVLERLVSLAERVRETSAKEAFWTAFSNFQKECPPITKNKTAKIYSAKGSYGYKYADLDEICQTIRPILHKFGLSYSWSAPRTDSTHATVICTVSHVHGHKEPSGEVSMPFGGSDGANPAQRVAIAITYARRYSLTGILGIAPEDDTDAQSTERAPDADKPYKVPVTPETESKETYNKAEVELATAALQTLMADPLFSDTDRIACSQWLKKKPRINEIKSKLAEKKGLLPQNPDAEPPAEEAS